jgi:hypothetical protein
VTAFLPPELSSGASFLKQGYTLQHDRHAAAGRAGTCNGSRRVSAPGYPCRPIRSTASAIRTSTAPTPTARSTVTTSTLRGLMPRVGARQDARPPVK